MIRMRPNIPLIMDHSFPLHTFANVYPNRTLLGSARLAPRHKLRRLALISGMISPFVLEIGILEIV